MGCVICCLVGNVRDSMVFGVVGLNSMSCYVPLFLCCASMGPILRCSGSLLSWILPLFPA